MNQRGTAAIEGAFDGRIGTTIEGRYVFERALALGGRGIVYLGRDRRLGTRVAIKVLRPELVRDPELLERYRDEVRTASALGHPHLLRVLDVGTLPDGATYSVAEYLEGDELSHILASEGPLPIGRALVLARQICDALVAAHSVGLVHRALEPESIFLLRLPGSEEDVVKVLDFGIASLLEAPEPVDVSEELVSSPRTLSPEQAMGRRPDPRSDVYQVGAILYEMLTGRPPFDGDSLVSVLAQKATLEVPRPRLFRPELPWLFEEIVLRALAREPRRRFASMRELRDALARLPLPEVPTSGVRERPLRRSELAKAGSTGSEISIEDLLSGSVPPPRISSNPPGRRASPLPPSGAPMARRSTGRLPSLDPQFVRFALVLLSIGVAAAIFGVVAESSIRAPGRSALPATAKLGAGTDGRPSRTLHLQLSSSPPGAAVFVGDRRIGTTPLERDWEGAPRQLATSGVSLRFVKEGHEARTVVRPVTDDGTVAVHVVLEPRP